MLLFHLKLSLPDKASKQFYIRGIYIYVCILYIICYIHIYIFYIYVSYANESCFKAGIQNNGDILIHKEKNYLNKISIFFSACVPKIIQEFE